MEQFGAEPRHGSSVDRVLIEFGLWIMLEEEFMSYRLCSSPKMEHLYATLILDSAHRVKQNVAEISWPVRKIPILIRKERL